MEWNSGNLEAYGWHSVPAQEYVEPSEEVLTAEAAALVDAREFADRDAIEAEAYALLSERQPIESAPLVQEYQDNARTALLEALTASGHLSVVEISGSDVEDINRQVLKRLVNGYSEDLPRHEQARRFHELCNELVIQRLHRAIAAGTYNPDTALLEISDFPETLGRAEAERIGYRASNMKGMVRSTHLRQNDDGSYTRVIEQMSRSNGTAATTYNLMYEAGVAPATADTADLAMLRTPLMYSGDDLREGVVDVQRILDSYAGRDVLYGDSDFNPQHVPYEAVRDESLQREAHLDFFVNRLADFDRRLEEMHATGLISKDEWQNSYNAELVDSLRLICRLNPSYARDCFGQVAGERYEAAAVLEAQGYYEEADQMMQSAREVEEAVVICGGIAMTAERRRELGLETDNDRAVLEQAKKDWQWKKGRCIVKLCTSPNPTEVGPCEVCHKCQARFDGEYVLDDEPPETGTEHIDRYLAELSIAFTLAEQKPEKVDARPLEPVG